MSYVGCAGTPCITPRVAAAAMSLVTARREREHNFVAFSHEIVPLLINQSMTLDDVLLNMSQVSECIPIEVLIPCCLATHPILHP